MDNQEFRRYAHELVDWMADYLDNVRRYPVKAQVQPKEIIAQLPEAPPQRGSRSSGFSVTLRRSLYRE